MTNESKLNAILSNEFAALITCTAILNSNGFKTLYNYPRDFKVDLIIFDVTLGPCLLSLVPTFNYPPQIGITAFSNPTYSTAFIGGHKYYSYIPFYSLPYSTDMDFIQRWENVFYYLFEYTNRHYLALPRLDMLIHSKIKKFKPYIGDLESRNILLLVNTHPALDFPEPLPPNVIPVGGLQIRNNVNPLPQALDDFINSAEKGAVLFSMGTNVKSISMPSTVQKSFLDAFASMPQYNFIWKFELPIRHTLPKNVITEDWIPQSDILAHKNVVGFISHSGLLSTHEAIWNAKPIISIPCFADQFRNSYKMKRLGVAEILELETITAENVKTTVLKVLENAR